MRKYMVEFIKITYRKSKQENQNKIEQKLVNVEALFMWLRLRNWLLDKVILLTLEFCKKIIFLYFSDSAS